jgi:phospholipase/lecithinase/hemolysin
MALDDELDSLKTLFPSIDIVLLDLFSLTNFLLDNPGGLNITDACTLQNVGAGCADPNTFVFWDGIHPTTSTHFLTAQAAAAPLVPLPAAVWMLFSAACVLFGFRRARVSAR